MKKIILVIAFSILAFGARSQFLLAPDGFEVAGNKSAKFLVVDFPDKPAVELYDLVYSFLSEIAADPALDIEAVQGESILFKGVSSLGAGRVGENNYTNIYIYDYSVKVQFRDGRIRIDNPQVDFPTESRSDPRRRMVLKGGGLWKDPIFNDSGRLREPDAKDKIESDVNSVVAGMIAACKPLPEEQDIEDEDDGDW